MKLHRLTLKNLNSLYDEHTIQLDRDFAGFPLFLIHGPTGAGKTTLLDAISLALFGSTPRLNGAVGAADLDASVADAAQHPGRMLSHDTAMGFAEVEYSVVGSDGVRTHYCARTMLRRAREKLDGKLQALQFQLRSRRAGEEDWQTLSDGTKHAEYLTYVHASLGGLKEEQFQQLVIVPQGRFAAFLHAKKGERAELLEQLTDTRWYRDVAKGFQGRANALANELALVRSQREARNAPTAEQLAETTAARDAWQTQLAARTLAVQKAEAHVGWGTDWIRLSHDVQAARNAVQTAQTALDALADDHARLQNWEAAAEARAAQAACRAAEVQLTQAQAEQKRIAHEGEGLTAQVAAASSALAPLTAAHQAAAAALDAAGPLLNQAREAYTQRQSAQNAAAEADNTARTAHAEHQQAAAALAAAEAEHTAATQALAAANTAREDSAGWEPLLADLPAVVARAASLDDAITQAHAAQQARDKAAHNLQLARQAEEKAAAQLPAALAAENGAATALAAAVQAAATAWEDATALLQSALPTRDVAAVPATQRGAVLHEAQDALRTQYRAWNDLGKLGPAVHAALAAHEKWQLDVADAATQLRAATDAVQTTAAAVPALRTAVDTAEVAARDEALIAELFRHRATLEDGKPCPVCGALEHPGAVANDEHRAAEQRQAERATHAQQVLTTARRALEAANTAATQAAAAHQNAQRRVADLDELAGALSLQLLQATGDIGGACLAVGIRDRPVFANNNWEAFAQAWMDFGLDDQVRHAKEQLTPDGQRLGDLVAAWQAADQERQAVLAEAATLSARVATLRQQAQVAVKDVEAATQRVADAEEQLAVRRKTMGAAADALMTAGQAWSLPVPWSLPQAAAPTGEAVVAWLSTVQARAASTRQAAEAVSACTQKVQTAAAQLAGCVPLAQERAQVLQRAQAAADSARAALAKLDAACAAFFDGKHPDMQEQELRQALTQALAACEKQQVALRAAQEQVAQNVGAAQAAASALAVAQTTTSETHARRDAALQSLGHDVAWLTALLAQQDEAWATRTTAALASARTALQSAQAQTTAREHALAAHVEQCPDGLVLPAPATPQDTWRAALVATRDEADAQRKEAEEALWSQNKQLQQWDALAQEVAALQAREAELRDAHTLWQGLHTTLGAGETPPLVEYVQHLQLGRLADLANVRLAKLLPRYALFVPPGSAKSFPLDLAVRDHHQGGVQRPISTLSGGETFVVSLALALALTDMQSTRLRIETLLLDEGFGTLDPDALNTVMNALHALSHDSGAQVGIISHVQSMQERIPARIEVRRIAAGRSTVQVHAG